MDYGGAKVRGRITSISEATGSKYSAIPVDNATGNFVKVEQRIPVRIDFLRDSSSAIKIPLLKAGMNVEVENWIKYQPKNSIMEIMIFSINGCQWWFACQCCSCSYYAC